MEKLTQADVDERLRVARDEGVEKFLEKYGDEEIFPMLEVDLMAAGQITQLIDEWVTKQEEENVGN